MVLGGIILDNSKLPEVLAEVSGEDFYREAHRKIFFAFLELYEQNLPIDLVTVSELLQEKGQLADVGGASYLASLIDSIPTTSHVTHYAQIVREKAIQRQIRAKAWELSRSIQLSQIRDRIYELTELIESEIDEAIKFCEFCPEEVVDEETETITGYPFPIPKGIVGLVAGQGEAGKSFFSLYLCLSLCKVSARFTSLLRTPPLHISKRLKYLVQKIGIEPGDKDIFQNFRFACVPPL